MVPPVFKVVLLFLLLCATALAAGGPTGPLTLQSDPGGAEVLVPEEYRRDGTEKLIGIADGRTIRLDGSEFRRSAKYRLVYRLPGYEPRTVEMVMDGGGLAQPEPAIRLRPTSFGTWLADTWQHHTLAVLGGIFALGIIGIVAWRFLHQRRIESETIQMMARADVVSVSGVDKWLGKELGGYKLKRRIGSGGMGAVYLGEPTATRRDRTPRAIKVMHEDLARDPEFRKRLKREVVLSQKLEHPNVVVPLAGSMEGDVLFTVMELIVGKPLSTRIPSKGLPLPRAMRILLPVFNVVAEAHRLGIVHRDLKPENIMMTEAGEVKVMDFGLARTKEGSKVTETGTLVGTPVYMSPEQIHGEVDARTDQYALGVIAYELLCGRPPFYADDAMKLFTMHLEDAPPPLLERRPDLPPEVCSVIERMLAKRPDERYPTVEDALTELQKAARFP